MWARFVRWWYRDVPRVEWGDWCPACGRTQDYHNHGWSLALNRHHVKCDWCGFRGLEAPVKPLASSLLDNDEAGKLTLVK